MNFNKLGRKINKRLAQKNVHFFSDDFECGVDSVINESMYHLNKEREDIKEYIKSVPCYKTRGVGRLNGTMAFNVTTQDNQSETLTVYFSEYHHSNPRSIKYMGIMISECGTEIEIERGFANDFELIEFITSI
ncbi:hypothetical protein [Aeromonas popoffii]|uniref:hypothetical protein n=1 Tax=Aeromonas popoffii TaxID=70856 RepID=UPI0030D29595